MSPLLPDKFVPEHQSLVGQGALVLTLLSDRPMSVAQLFVETRSRLAHMTYDAFVETLDALYALGAIDSGREPLLRVSQ